MTNSLVLSSPPVSAPFTARQREILERARELVEETGLANLTMKKVAERVGFSEPAIYRHFPNKEALVFALVDLLGERLLGGMQKIATERSLPPEERIERMVRHHVGVLRATRGLPLLLIAEGLASGNAALLARMNGVLRGYQSMLVALLEEAGLPRPPALPHQALLFFGLPAVLGIHFRAFPEQLPTDAEIDALVHHFVRALIAGAGGGLA
jgi:AcrR family transcriptional regulator